MRDPQEWTDPLSGQRLSSRTPRRRRSSAAAATAPECLNCLTPTLPVCLPFAHRCAVLLPLISPCSRCTRPHLFDRVSPVARSAFPAALSYPAQTLSRPATIFVFDSSTLNAFHARLTTLTAYPPQFTLPFTRIGRDQAISNQSRRPSIRRNAPSPISLVPLVMRSQRET